MPGKLRDVTPLPEAPTAPDAPPVPGAARLRAGLTIPRITPEISKADNADFLARYAAWGLGGSLPEYIVWEYLVTRKGWRPGIEFVYQASFIGGRTQYGGFVADFLIRPGNMIWNVQGLRYHLTQTKDRAADIVAKAILAGQGYRVLFLWEDDLLERPDYVLEAALRGQESNRHKDDVGLYV